MIGVGVSARFEAGHLLPDQVMILLVVGTEQLWVELDEELTEWRAAVGDEWADWRGCICNGPYQGSMVGCDGGCDNWFHFACVGITRLPRGEFYCEECKARREAKRRRIEAAASTPRPKPAVKRSAPTPRPTPDDRRRARTKKSGRRPAAKPSAKRLKPPAPRTRPAAPKRAARSA